MLFLEARQVLFTGTLVLLALRVGAQTSNPDSSNPGCYSRCKFLITDYDPTRLNDLCNKKKSLGDVFLSNMEDCADCVRKNDGLSSYFDESDAQDVLDMVNLCQSLFPESHEEMVSAMSVIKNQGDVVGTLVSAPRASRAFGTPAIDALATGIDVTTTTTEPTASSQSEPTNSTDEDSKPSSEENKSWIAGAVIGPVVGAALLRGIYVFILKRRKQRRNDAEPAIDEKKEEGGWATYEKTELPTKEHELHELNAENAKEAPTVQAPQELNSTVVAELPGDERC